MPEQPSPYNVFRAAPKKYKIRSDAYVNTRNRVVRVWSDNIGKWCDVQIIGSAGDVMNAKQNYGFYAVLSANAEDARITDKLSDDTAAVGNLGVGDAFGFLKYEGPLTEVQENTSLQRVSNTGPQEAVYKISDPTPEGPVDEETKNNGKAGITILRNKTTKTGGVLIGNGQGDEMYAGGAGVGLFAENGPVFQNRENTDMGSNTDSLNFLQHYLIPLAKSAGLHIPPHLINFPKYVGIGMFVKNIYQAVKFTVKEIKKEI